MTFDEFMQRMLSAFPEATVGSDNDGQLIIHTNLRLSADTNSDTVEVME